VSAAATAGLTGMGRRLVVAVTALSVAHHLDHLARQVTGWPLAGGLNAFSISLLVYPVVAAGLVLSARRRVGARFWAVLAGGGALFVAAVHVGPAAGDAVSTIPDQHLSPASAVLALGVLAAFFAALVAHCVYETRLLIRARAGRRA